MDVVPFFGKEEPNMKDNGTVDTEKVVEATLGQMVIVTLENLKMMGRKRATGLSIMLMGTALKVTTKTTREKAGAR